jgi:hypothetical protein
MAIAEPRTCNPSEMSPAINAPARATQQVSLEVFHLLAKDLLQYFPIFANLAQNLARFNRGKTSTSRSSSIGGCEACCVSVRCRSLDPF